MEIKRESCEIMMLQITYSLNQYLVIITSVYYLSCLTCWTSLVQQYYLIYIHIDPKGGFMEIVTTSTFILKVTFHIECKMTLYT
jgi:hypothetical protein